MKAGVAVNKAGAAALKLWRYVFRSARTDRFVSAKEAAANKDTTYADRVSNDD